MTADGYTRSMKRTDFTHSQTMKQLQIAKRPFVLTFEPRELPMEFTFDSSTVGRPTSAADKHYAKYVPRAWVTDAVVVTPSLISLDFLHRHVSKNKKKFSIIRDLGLGLREEVDELAHCRCRVSGVVPGGMVSPSCS